MSIIMKTSVDLFTFKLGDGDSQHVYSYPMREVKLLASELGMDIEVDKELIWFLKQALVTILPRGWAREKDPKGGTQYHNAETGTTTEMHPLLFVFRAAFRHLIETSHTSQPPPLDPKPQTTRQRRLEPTELVSLSTSADQEVYFTSLLKKTEKQAEAITNAQRQEQAMHEAELFYSTLITGQKPPESIVATLEYHCVDPMNVLSVARMLGIDDDYRLFWLARVYCVLPLPPLWKKSYDSLRNVVYLNIHYQFSLKAHPGTNFFYKYIKKLRFGTIDDQPTSMIFLDPQYREIEVDLPRMIEGVDFITKISEEPVKELLCLRKLFERKSSVEETFNEVMAMEIAEACGLDFDEDIHLLGIIYHHFDEMKLESKLAGWEFRFTLEGQKYWYHPESQQASKSYPFKNKLKGIIAIARIEAFQRFGQVMKQPGELHKGFGGKSQQFVAEVRQDVSELMCNYLFDRLDDFPAESQPLLPLIEKLDFRPLTKAEIEPLLFACPFKIDETKVQKWRESEVEEGDESVEAMEQEDVKDIMDDIRKEIDKSEPTARKRAIPALISKPSSRKVTKILPKHSSPPLAPFQNVVEGSGMNFLSVKGTTPEGAPLRQVGRKKTSQVKVGNSGAIAESLRLPSQSEELGNSDWGHNLSTERDSMRMKKRHRTNGEESKQPALEDRGNLRKKTTGAKRDSPAIHLGEGEKQEDTEKTVVEEGKTETKPEIDDTSKEIPEIIIQMPIDTPPPPELIPETVPAPIPDIAPAEETKLISEPTIELQVPVDLPISEGKEMDTTPIAMDPISLAEEPRPETPQSVLVPESPKPVFEEIRPVIPEAQPTPAPLPEIEEIPSLPASPEPLPSTEKDIDQGSVPVSESLEISGKPRTPSPEAIYRSSPTPEPSHAHVLMPAIHPPTVPIIPCVTPPPSIFIPCEVSLQLPKYSTPPTDLTTIIIDQSLTSTRTEPVARKSISGSMLGLFASKTFLKQREDESSEIRNTLKSLLLESMSHQQEAEDSHSSGHDNPILTLLKDERTKKLLEQSMDADDFEDSTELLWTDLLKSVARSNPANPFENTVSQANINLTSFIDKLKRAGKGTFQPDVIPIRKDSSKRPSLKSEISKRPSMQSEISDRTKSGKLYEMQASTGKISDRKPVKELIKLSEKCFFSPELSPKQPSGVIKTAKSTKRKTERGVKVKKTTLPPIMFKMAGEEEKRTGETSVHKSKRSTSCVTARTLSTDIESLSPKASFHHIPHTTFPSSFNDQEVLQYYITMLGHPFRLLPSTPRLTHSPRLLPSFVVLMGKRLNMNVSLLPYESMESDLLLIAYMAIATPLPPGYPQLPYAAIVSLPNGRHPGDSYFTLMLEYQRIMRGKELKNMSKKDRVRFVVQKSWLEFANEKGERFMHNFMTGEEAIASTLSLLRFGGSNVRSCAPEVSFRKRPKPEGKLRLGTCQTLSFSYSSKLKMPLQTARVSL